MDEPPPVDHLRKLYSDVADNLSVTPFSKFLPMRTHTMMELIILTGGVHSDQSRVNRLKKYIQWDLVPVYGEKHPGTGKHRQFSREALIIVDVLEIMHELGMKVIGRQKFIQTIAADAHMLMMLNELRLALRDSGSAH